MSFIPYLKETPTQTQTGTEKPTETPAESDQAASKNEGHATKKVISRDDSFGPRQWKSTLVPLAGKNRALNEFSVERVDEKSDQNLVMLHGYGAGLGFFYKNYEQLSRVPGWRIYALDLLGMGRSSRPPFRIHSKDRQESIKEAEDWFIDALEEWRVQKKLDRFTLLGHSLGGYMAVAYALKYPGHLNKLILASPVGIPEDPYAVNAELPKDGDSAAVDEIARDAHETTGKASEGDQNNFMNAKSKAEGSDQPRRRLPKWAAYLWDANVISPFSLVRWSGPLGPRFVSGWTSRRFSHLPSEEAQALHTYSYSLFRQRGSGEYALSYILAPGAFARSPLIRRIAGVGRQMITLNGSVASSVAPNQKSRENGLPVIFMYGENDWMDVGGGYAAEQKLKEERERVLQSCTPAEKAKEQGSAKVFVIKKAGHHVYLDGWEEFNEVMQEEMRDTSQSESRQ